ncbi:hypothetical protein BSY238_809 [Methyloversatilis sp. RAC08]|uniref:hypothetical protein n=1 Tax=Methyloversatilis sp. RAC08 TaxID=1842540 RepID=UPI00083CC528|nr:hypothetical protein [Methyloversatilis sp. RAC08]AOF82040.1 hypothetical protein BSY238_809 [Methyloversatilis sp. RAC08]
MTKMIAVLMFAGLTVSTASFAGSTTTHESIYEPGYLSSLSDKGALGGRAASGDVLAHESTFDPVHLRALSQAPAGKSFDGLVINHESVYAPGVLSSFTSERAAPMRSAQAPADRSAI